MRVSFQLLPEQPAPELLDAIAAADAFGYYACYSADQIYHKDPWLLFAAAAAGIDFEGLPDLGEQVRLFGEQILPEVSSP